MPQTVLVLVGLPASGKSTLAALFEEAGWCVINQDRLGSRKACEAACSAALAGGRSCVIDRCNFDMAQRRPWLELARWSRGAGVRVLAFCLDLPIELCTARAVARAGHATLSPEEAPAVIQRFASDWQWPQRREGFDGVIRATSPEQATELARQLIAETAASTAAAAVEPAVPPGFLPQQQGWAMQQRQHYGSRADSAGSWRRGADGEPQQQQPPPPPPRQLAGDNNVVPFSGRRRSPPPHHGRQQQTHHVDHSLPRRHPWQRHGHDESSGTCLDVDTAKPVLMFDANGCVTSHTSMRRSAGVHRARPGIEHLRRLNEHFHIGMYSSATTRTVDTALALLEAAAGPGNGPLFERRFLLHRSHTMLAPAAHVAGGGKEWDTVKPLRPYFSRLHRVILIDDDSFKAVQGEEANMLLMPRWEKDNPSDVMVGHLADALLRLAERLGDDPEGDVRLHTAAAAAELAAAAAAEEAARGGREASGSEGSGGGGGAEDAPVEEAAAVAEQSRVAAAIR